MCLTEFKRIYFQNQISDFSISESEYRMRRFLIIHDAAIVWPNFRALALIYKLPYITSLALELCMMFYSLVD